MLPRHHRRCGDPRRAGAGPEPTWCAGYPSTQWNAAGLQEFTKNHLYPAFRTADINTKVLVWSPTTGTGTVTSNRATPPVDDPATAMTPVRRNRLAWLRRRRAHQTAVHNQYPTVNAYMTEQQSFTHPLPIAGRDLVNPQSNKRRCPDVTGNTAATSPHCRSKPAPGLETRNGPSRLSNRSALRTVPAAADAHRTGEDVGGVAYAGRTSFPCRSPRPRHSDNGRTLQS